MLILIYFLTTRELEAAFRKSRAKTVEKLKPLSYGTYL